MLNNIRKYSVSDLKVGMYVSEQELSGIWDMHIVLTDTSIRNNVIFGKIGFIGKELNEESDALNKLNTTIADIYNSKIDTEDDIIYEE